MFCCSHGSAVCIHHLILDCYTLRVRFSLSSAHLLLKGIIMICLICPFVCWWFPMVVLFRGIAPLGGECKVLKYSWVSCLDQCSAKYSQMTPRSSPTRTRYVVSLKSSRSDLYWFLSLICSYILRYGVSFLYSKTLPWLTHFGQHLLMMYQ